MSDLKPILTWFLGRFYGISLALAGAGFGLLWALLGLHKALLVFLLAALGWLTGKWLDEGAPGPGFLHWLRRLFRDR